jgi:hypothetical protein
MHSYANIVLAVPLLLLWFGLAFLVLLINALTGVNFYAPDPYLVALLKEPVEAEEEGMENS